MSRLLLGPVVGHTDHTSSRIWIRVRDDPADYELRVLGVGLFPFVSTEPTALEFGTALALAENLRPEWEYRYRIVRKGRVIPGSAGTFRTMPMPGSEAELLFVSLSCSDGVDLGMWPLLARYVKNAKPRFLVMLGDQVYVDEQGVTLKRVWPELLDTKPAVRREALADKYQEQWSREPIRTILANTPTYMMWDDHEIKNGWGSFAPDSPTLAARYPRGAEIASQFNSFFEDARDVFWHFEGCRNPSPPESLGLPSPGTRKGMPFLFRCGRLAVLVLDDRGARDVWREVHPVLGDDQWQFLDQAVGNLPADVDALVVVVPLPLTSMDPDGTTQRMLGDRTDDIDLFKKGDKKGLIEFSDRDFMSSLTFNRYGTALGGPPIFGDPGNAKLGSLTDVRDNWAHQLCRGEQEALIRTIVSARLTNRPGSQPRSLTVIGGDLHAGGLFDLSLSDPEVTLQSLVTSGISRQAGGRGIVGILMDEDFDVADGIHAKLKRFTNRYNFGITHGVFGGGLAMVTTTLADVGSSAYWTIKLP
jgi:PhoD-like phosphatase